jgi:hypothetical protein
MLAFQVLGEDILAAKFRAAVTQIKAEKTFWTADVGEILQQSIQQNILRQGLEDTGALFYSGRTFNHTKNGISVGFGRGLDYAYALEHGARPHKIYAGSSTTVGSKTAGKFVGPSHKSSLSFYWEKRGEWVWPKSVNHPGNKPYKFMWHGSTEAIYPILMLFSSRLRVIFGGLSGL